MSRVKSQNKVDDVIIVARILHGIHVMEKCSTDWAGQWAFALFNVDFASYCPCASAFFVLIFRYIYDVSHIYIIYTHNSSPMASGTKIMTPNCVFSGGWFERCKTSFSARIPLTPLYA